MTLHAHQRAVAERLRTWQQEDFARRLWARDPTLWSPTPAPELSDRMGWLTLPESMRERAGALTEFARAVRDGGTRHVVLLGMGGSSLAPEVFQRTFGNIAGHPALIVLDSTHPDAVRAVESRIDLARALFLVSSKSGTTTETLSLYRYFWHRMDHVAARGRHFAAITDPNTPLARLAVERGFLRTFDAPPDVGGRYSALTVFGLVPAALIGVDLHTLLDRARHMAEASAARVAATDNPALSLGAALGELALAGLDKVTFFASPAVEALPSWIEQLIAESTGKDEKGIIPVVDEPALDPGEYGADRFFVYVRLSNDRAHDLDGRVNALEAAGHPTVRIGLDEAADVGREFFRWELAVAAAGAVLGIHPFNQPDVQLAKELAQQAMQKKDGSNHPGEAAEELEVSAARAQQLAETVRGWLAGVRAGDYLAIHAYVAPTEQSSAMLREIRRGLGARLRVATTLGFGPRFLHSTGQLHKGGPNSGVFLQLVDTPVEDLAVPETDYTFGALIRAQALGDLAALRQRGRRVLRVSLGRDVPGGLARVAEALRA
ncbi:MAG TPA: hypothetical protein VFM39_00060 [bacterium]|nr:hypothetical protein [bacterium]